MPTPASSSDDESSIGRRGTSAKGIARRREILDRSLEVFRERGSEGTSLRRIAEAIGVSHAAVMHYFRSREQLRLAVYQHTERHRHESMQDHPAPGAVGRLVQAASVNVKVPGFVQLYSTLVASAVEEGDSESREFITRRFARVREETAHRVKEQQERGEIRADVDPEQVAAMLVAASDGLQTQWLLDSSVDLEGDLRMFETLLRP